MESRLSSHLSPAPRTSTTASLSTSTPPGPADAPKSRATPDTTPSAPTPTPTPASASAPKRRMRVGAQTQPRGQSGDWPLRSALQRQRIGVWFTWTRKTRLRMSLRALRDAAAADGVELSVSAIRRLESMADLHIAAERQWVALDNVLWLLAYSGQTLADLERFIQSGDLRYMGNLTDPAPSIESLADRVRVRFLSLSPARQATVASFIEHERYLDELDMRAALGMPPGSVPGTLPAATSEPTLSPDTLVGSQVDMSEATQRTLDELGQAAETIREAQRRDQAQQQSTQDETSAPGSARGHAQGPAHGKRRRQK